MRILGALMSLNDPQWGRRTNQGPPDLDELWRDFNRKLSGLFGRRGGGGDGTETPDPRPRRLGGGAGLLLGLLFVVWLASGVFIVYEGQRGVVVGCGTGRDTTRAGPGWPRPSMNITRTWS